MGTIKLKKTSTETEQLSASAAVISPNAENVAAEKQQWDDPAVLKEFSEKTNATSRHYKLNNGTAKSIISAAPSNYFDESENQWKPIDNSLTEKEFAYESTGGKYKTEITKPEKGKSIKMTASGIAISWEYLGKQSTSEVQAQPFAFEGDTVPTTLEVESAIEGTLQSKGSKAVYENADKDTDIEYSLSGDNIKENIIVKEKAEEYRYLFALNTQGLKLRVSEDNESLELYTETASESGETLTKTEATIPAPFMYDVNGESSDDVYFELAPETDGKYTFAVIASADWINAENRAFPVTIDPQIIMNSSSYLTKKVEYRNYYSSGSGSGSGSGTSISSWYTASSNYIKVSRTSSQEYRTTLTIQKSNLNLLDLKISAVRLVLKPYRILSTGSCYIGSKYVTFSSTSDLDEKVVDITNSFRNAGTTCSISVTYSSYLNVEFYFDGVNAPTLEIEYMTNENSRPAKQSFTLVGELAGEYNVAEGNMTAAFRDVAESDSVLGFGISHVFKKSRDELYVGKNFRLNLNEMLIKNSDSVLDANYIYTDANGDKHGFKDTYYYIDTTGAKKTISSKSSIAIDMDGKLTYTTGGKTYDVYQEQRTATGLKAVTKIEGFKYADYLEQRSDEYKQLEQQKQSYENTLKSMVLIRTSDGDIVYRLESYLDKDKFSTFYNNIGTSSSTYLLCSESEAYSYKSLILQEKSLDYQYDSLTDQMESININKAYNTYLRDEESDKSSENKAYVFYRDTVNNLSDQYTNTQNQRALVGSYSTASDTQREVVYRQTQLMKNNEALYKMQVEQYYKEYLNVDYQLKQYDRQMPVNYLTDGKIVKGYNAEGQLVAILDNYENVISVEYDEDGKIQSVYDGDNKQIVFEYNPTSGLLSSITDTRGRKTGYEYNSDGELIKVTFANEKTVSFTYDANENIQTVESSDKLKSTLTYTDAFKLNKVTNASTVSGFAHDQALASATTNISETTFTFSSTLTTIADDKNNKQYYKVNDDGNVYEYYAEEDGKVVKAEKYDYIVYEKDNVQYAKKDSLYTKAYNSFTSSDFTGGDTVNAVLDEFNNPSTKTTNARALSDGTTQQATVNYEYDDNHKCVKETAVVTIKEGTSVLNTYTQITAYNYNAAGNVVRKESYIEGEELTTGKSVEETVYDEKGNAIKSFSYNSLDSSSKFYTESEVAENGQTLADYDETGENKTEYEYISGTNVVRTQKLPNGSKFAYGHDESDTVTSITQSTEEGEENSTQTRYTCGEVTELVSGNNVVRYAYDAKRRVSKISLNGTENYIVNTYTDETTVDGITVTVDACASKNANGETITNYTDKQGKLRRITTSAGKHIDYAYNAKGETTSVIDGVSGNTEAYEYDNDYDRLKKYTRNVGKPSEYTETYAYDGYGRVSGVTQSGAASRTYTYAYKDNAARELESVTTGAYKFSPQTDKLGRNAGREITESDVKLSAEYIYYRKVGDHATSLPGSVYFGKKKGDILSITENVKYKYDNMGNICRIDENGAPVVWYKYDALNRLIREDNKLFGKTWLYSYDNNGNILCKRETAFTLKENVEESEFESVQYEYDGDKLLTFGTEACAYDAIGNPTTYRGKSVSWSNGRQMTNYDGTAFTYDGLGRRLSKGNITYTYDGNGRVIKQSNGIEFLYDNSGVAGIIYNGGTYLYRKDGQGNIVALIDNTGNVVVEYKYDAWGNHAVLDANGADINDASHIGNLNPFRYRGYYYDTETGLYYLKSRYYDPEVGRFITIDDISYLDPETINGLNLYAYCGNNPVMHVDPNGTFILSLFLICLGIGLVAGAVTGGITAYNNGYRGWDLVGQIALGGLTGAAVGAAVGLVAGMGTAAIIGGLSSVAGKFVSDITASAISQSWAFGSWEDYAVAFIFGGLLKGVKMPNIVKAAMDIAIRPFVNQVVKMGTQGNSFNVSNYAWTVFSRAITYGFGFGKFAMTLMGQEFSISFGKSIFRGFFSGLWKKFN